MESKKGVTLKGLSFKEEPGSIGQHIASSCGSFSLTFWRAKKPEWTRMRMRRSMLQAFVGRVCRAETRSEKVIGLPWLWMTSGMPSSIAHFRDMEFMKLKTWFHMWA